TLPHLTSTMMIVVLSHANVPSDSGKSVGIVAAVTASCSTRALADLAAMLIDGPGKSVSSGISDCAQERVGILARIQPCVLDDHGHVGFDDARKLGTLRNRLRLLQIVEPNMLRPPSRHCDFVGPSRLPVGEEHRDAYVSVSIARVQDAGGLVALQFRFGTVTPSGDIAFRNGPPSFSDRLHHHLLLICRPGRHHLVPRFSSRRAKKKSERQSRQAYAGDNLRAPQIGPKLDTGASRARIKRASGAKVTFRINCLPKIIGASRVFRLIGLLRFVARVP